MARPKMGTTSGCMKYFNANPKGKFAGDCVIRAISVGMGRDYYEVYKEMFELSLSIGYLLDDTQTIEKYLAKNGWVKMPQPRKSNNTKFTGEEFVKNRIKRTMIANIGGGHMVAIKEGYIIDTWDSRYGTIGNYWIKKA